MRRMLRAVAVAAVVTVALVLMVQGLGAQVYFEPTEEAVAEARHGAALIAWACVLLSAAAAYACLVMERSPWLGAALMAPVVLCGGLTAVMPESLWGVLAALVAVPAAAVAGLVILLRPGR
ncbi:hypothetical protein FHP29_15210 [Nocardioides albidus]|uniref:Uncharacterized protein n=1 Tax=Nocardioides albidus TaxID=1517589 RepID=A0A5C4VTL6_9ACTN|nr:hypothetical protein [Nocardioides albidus]TNM38579.1 hypothetical protein FHP29_15210 [Nocardioides albidus]